MGSKVEVTNSKTGEVHELGCGRLKPVGMGTYFPHPSGAKRAIKAFRESEFDNPSPLHLRIVKAGPLSPL
jgi:hypothetical protein